MVSKKNSKSNDTKIFAQIRQGKCVFFFNLELEQHFFMLKNYRFEIPDILLTTWPTSLQLKTYSYCFSCFKAPLTNLKHQFIALENICSKLVFWKEFSASFYLPCQKNKRALSVNFAGTIYRILKNQKTYIFVKITLAKNITFMLWQVQLNVIY